MFGRDTGGKGFEVVGKSQSITTSLVPKGLVASTRKGVQCEDSRGKGKADLAVGRGWRSLLLGYQDNLVRLRLSKFQQVYSLLLIACLRGN